MFKCSKFWTCSVLSVAVSVAVRDHIHTPALVPNERC